MKIFVTSKNSGPSWASDPTRILYIGFHLDKAVEAVGDFRKYETKDKSHYDRFPYLFSAIPQDMPRKMIKFYFADGWWYSIVEINIEDNLEST